MSYKRITVSLPDYLYEDMLALTPTRGVSGYVAEAVQKRVLQQKVKPEDAVTNFLALRAESPKKNIKQILNAIHKGRT
ncbi:MAG: hypothetical protein UR39_C0005G0041 [Candidatus Woesebacteria bacterium GW2011_GWA1_33_30]|uniref:CopG family transcriptional regulator n=1 Tax=Candidatus Woesebacteria bacterium GW2011_GWA2_33_28 TaxID=1618561 RepID=A0A0F9ZSI7_9BACT|nr:MAG: hypothetical protein UR38_C0005G0041 [Candidatus Woesebacteria bacterium GW2011_GWA2_33_28]KKP48159.1 MAG: hypothetical protein UR39_C0005G0041 [Candidatus Woesebacteria bacterium GW2011_GWA1_33_30]KKP49401.1 MAG: hypothetical protein UR40_C0006G0041 [Microgenomates group bacterium GW2011_GWC1_33_32]KKP52127.1 MAG: hypothetical protein UR44_C0004G0041 [Candidatus Woesebacteria bacterium GW2011_GWB1_33_38]